MANFKTHVNWGFIVAVLVVGGLLWFFDLDIKSLIIIFLAVILGSFLPDVDSDSSVPFRIIFGFLSIFFAFFSVYILHEIDHVDFWLILLVPVTVFVFVRFVLGEVFKKMSHHRGIWHSVPAAFLVGIFTVILIQQLNFLERKETAIYIGVSVFIGYMIHLFLDEIYATVNLTGRSLKLKKSLGSALKWRSPSNKVTLFVYGFIFVLFIIFWYTQ